MSSNNNSKNALTGIAIAVSLLLAFSVSVSFNWYYTNYYLKQEITNVFNQLIDTIGNQTQRPIIVNVTIPSINQTGNQTGNVTQPTPEPTPKPVPTCEPDERYNTTLKDCIEIPPEVCSSNQKYNATDNLCYPRPSPTPQPTDNQSTSQPEPGPQPTCKSTEIYNATLNECVAKPTPTPQPVPQPTPTPTQSRPFTFTVVGDISTNTDSTKVFNAIKAQNSTYVFVLGDLGYADNLDFFKKTYGSLGDKMFCVVGNHESANEDGTTSLQKATQEYCGDSYWIKDGSSVFFLFNTNGDLKTQSSKAVQFLHNTTVMTGVKNIHILSHKPCVSPPNSHHPAPETTAIKSFCDTLKSNIPSNIKVDYIQAHNHVMSSSADGTYKQVGSGGRSHYTCGTSTAFPFCDNAHYGFLKATVKADGTTTYQFIDYNGKTIN